jgi:protein-S-isoprenylcysteine O-methyltransferase Ste14
MMKPEQPRPESRDGLVLPRWAIPFVWAVLVVAIQILLPWAFAMLGPRLGWSQLGPAWWNLVGLVGVGAGLASYSWALVLHYRTYRRPVQLGFSPPHLVTDGPYRFSRNPMYVSAFLVWLGWAIFYGSPTVLVGLGLLWSLFAFRVIPREERQLEALFGDEFRDYKRSVRRWAGRF